MMFIDPIITTHVNTTTDRPLMNSKVIEWYISAYVMNPRRGYQKPFAISALIPNHKYGHCVRPNRVALKYPDFKK
jgi:hypothetical protein